MSNHKYQKLPVRIEAFQMTADNAENQAVWPSWLHDAASLPNGAVGELFQGFPDTPDTGVWFIKTLEGTMRVSQDDWIIRGVQGELYPCKPDIFDATYAPVSEDAQTAEQLAEEIGQAQGNGSPRFVLVLQDVPGGIDCAGVQEPAEFTPSSPSHMVGAFLGANWSTVLAAAQHHARKPAAQEPVLLTDQRERTIILPEGG